MPDGYQYVQGRSRILSATFTAPEAADDDQVLAAYTDDGAEAVFVDADLADPDVPRNITATAGGTAADIKAIQVIVTGLNVWGQTITETLPAFTVNTAGTVTGSKAFYRVTGVTIPAHDGTGATTAIGVGEKLGLPTTLTRNTVVAAYLGGAKEGTAPTVAVDSDEVEKNTVDLNSALNGTDVIVDYYK
jgi:hypothetical protein